jgi:hypothetical protein
MLPEENSASPIFIVKPNLVNYAPVGQSGLILQQGDIIHIGSLTFRFGSGSGIASDVRGSGEESVEPVEKDTASPDSLSS